MGDIFKDIQTDVMMCQSWLLSPKNMNFVAKDSNIAKFANMFSLTSESEGAEQHFRWIFDIIADEKTFAKNKKKLGYYMDLSKFNATTSLQKAAKDYVMAGGEFSSGKGLLVTKDIIG